ncbi:MAG: DUF6524 family protein [Alphaproteobacteria bacterium]
MPGQFQIEHFLLRLALTAALVFGTYNPMGFSAYHWIKADIYHHTDLIVLIVIALIIVYAFFARVIYSIIELPGLAIGVVMVALTILEIRHQIGAGAEGSDAMQMIALATVSLYAAVMLSYPHVVERLTGQVQKRYLTKN